MRLFLNAATLLLPSLVALSSAHVSREGHRSFTDSLTPQLYENKNECTSSWGISMMLDLVNPGGTGATKQELCDVVSLCSNASQTELLWSPTISRLVNEYNGSCVSDYVDSSGERQCSAFAPILEIANSVWIDVNRTLEPAYAAIVEDFVKQTNLSDDGAGDTVNAWVNASTRGLIDSIVDPGPLFPPYVMLAVNSIYLKAQWATQFLTSKTNQDVFYDSPARVTPLAQEANFMHMVEYFPYSKDAIPGYQILRLPYASSTLSMLLILPLSNSGRKISSEEIVSSISSLESQRMALALPKFKFESKYKDSLKASLKSIGLTAPFDDQEGFCDLFRDTMQCQYLDFIAQKTSIEVNEFGTIATAVTAGGAVMTSLPVDVPELFLADHPFQFCIYDEGEELVLFEGRVGAPTVVNDATAELQSKHDDDDFWTSTFFVDPTVPVFHAPSTSPTPSSAGSTPPPSSSDASSATPRPSLLYATLPEDPASRAALKNGNSGVVERLLLSSLLLAIVAF